MSGEKTDPTTGAESQDCDIRRQRRSIICNLITCAFGFCFILTAYISIENLQSSINANEGLGLVSVSVVYALFLTCSIVGGPYVVYRLTPKWALLLGWISHTLFIIANFYPTWGTMIPSSVILGACTTVIWIVQGVYVTSLAQEYSNVTGQKFSMTLRYFNSIFFTINSLPRLFGNLLSSLILSTSTSSDGDTSRGNSTDSAVVYNTHIGNGTFLYMDPEDQHEIISDQVCGSGHCPYMISHRAKIIPPEQTLIYILLGVFLACNLTGIIITFFLKNIKQPSEVARKDSFAKRLGATWRLTCEPNLLLLMPIFTLAGVSNATVNGSFTQSFVSCSLGVGMLGYVMMCRGITHTLTCFLTGKLSQYIPSVIHIATAILMQTALGLAWLLWQPTAEEPWVFFLMVGMAGVADGLWKVHTGALTGGLFANQQEGAFAHKNMWTAIGNCAAFAYGPYLCFNVKTYIYLTLVALSAACYTALKVRLRKPTQDDDSVTDDSTTATSRDEQTDRQESRHLMHTDIIPGDEKQREHQLKV